jgi:hypothetical protein
MKSRIKEIKTHASYNVLTIDPFYRLFGIPPDDIDSDNFRRSNLPYFYRYK